MSLKKQWCAFMIASLCLLLPYSSWADSDTDCTPVLVIARHGEKISGGGLTDGGKEHAKKYALILDALNDYYARRNIKICSFKTVFLEDRATQSHSGMTYEGMLKGISKHHFTDNPNFWSQFVNHPDIGNIADNCKDEKGKTIHCIHRQDLANAMTSGGFYSALSFIKNEHMNEVLSHFHVTPLLPTENSELVPYNFAALHVVFFDINTQGSQSSIAFKKIENFAVKYRAVTKDQPWIYPSAGQGDFAHALDNCLKSNPSCSPIQSTAVFKIDSSGSLTKDAGGTAVLPQD